MTRGRPKGVLAPHSFTAKLASLDVGESLMLAENPTPANSTPIERAVTSLRSPALAGRRFSTSRVRYIDGDILRLAIRTTRTE